MHERIAVHSVAFAGAPLADVEAHWRALGVRRLSLIADQLAEPGLARMITDGRWRVESVTRPFVAGPLPRDAGGVAAARDGLAQTIDAAAAVGARAMYLLTGGRGALDWEAAADVFANAIEPGAAQARAAGVPLLIENASSLYVDIHLAHTLRDTIALAELAGVGICIDHFHCWTEAGLDGLVARALPLTGLVQISDYIPGDRALPARAVPGDGAIPIEGFVAQMLAGGYAHGFDLELVGPRIAAEGAVPALRRAGDVLGAMLDRLGAA